MIRLINILNKIDFHALILIIFVLGILLSIVGCTKVPDNYQKTIYSIQDVPEKSLYLYTIDSCEYLGYLTPVGGSNSCFLTHKGNCKNKIHK